MSLFLFLTFLLLFILLLLLLFITIPLSFDCCDEEISLFVGKIKEILILILILDSEYPGFGHRDGG